MMENKNIQNRLAPLCGGEKKGEISLYIDGKLDTKRKGAANMDNAAFIRFGGWGSENHKGGLDEVFLFKKGVVLEAADIQKIYKSGWKKARAVSPTSKLTTLWSIIRVK